MINLDQQQEQCLHDIAEVIGRLWGPAFAMCWLRCTRWMMRVLLSMNRFFAPRSFKRWNDARVVAYQQENAR